MTPTFLLPSGLLPSGNSETIAQTLLLLPIPRTGGSVLHCRGVTYMFKDISIERIKLDEGCWKGMQTRLTEFYFKYLLAQSAST